MIMQGGSVIELSVRQTEIMNLVKQYEPITGEQLAEYLGVSRPTIRSDLSLLVMIGYLDAKPKVGYFLGKPMHPASVRIHRLKETKVKDVQGVPVIISDTSTVQDAVVMLFLENVGSLIVTNQEHALLGMVSRKDLLKVTLGNPNGAAMPISLVMTRQPNIITADPDDSIIVAAEKMIKHQVGSLPVVTRTEDKDGRMVMEVVGRVTTTTMTRLLFDAAKDLL